MPDLTSPPWVRAKEGVPELLRTNKASEEELAAFIAQRDEAQFMHNTMGRGEMSEEQKYLVGVVQLETVARANIDLADKLAPERLLEYERMLATALHKQGRNQEALDWLPETDEESRALRVRIAEIQAAIEKPDGELHSHECKRRVEDGLEFDRRFTEDEVFSLPHGRIVRLHRCTECGELNATPEMPDRQKDRAELRMKGMARMTVKDSTVNMNDLSDAKLLKADATV